MVWHITPYPKKVSNFTDMSNQEENLDDVIASLLDDLVDEETMTDEVQKKSEKPVTLTERAAKQVLKIITDDQDHNDLYLRVAVEGGGCSGLSYKLGLDYSTENDITSSVSDPFFFVRIRILVKYCTD